MKYICTLCNYVLDENGLPSGPDEGTIFEDLPESWSCPDCAAKKEFFQPCACVSLPQLEKPAACDCAGQAA